MADISVQLATIGIRRKLQTRWFTVLRGVTATLRRWSAAALNSIFVTPAVLRPAAPTSYPLTVGGPPRRPLLCRAAPRHSASVLATGAVRIPGRIRSG
ncbi:MAG: hypothetical protein ACRDQV_10525 [Pseudonocardiaceae bacterium]